MLTGLFASTSAVVMAYVGAMSRTTAQRTERVSFINAVNAAAYVLGPTLGGLLHGISIMVRCVLCDICCVLCAWHGLCRRHATSLRCPASP